MVGQVVPLGQLRVQSIQIDEIEVGPNFTSLRWTLRSLANPPLTYNVYPTGPPVTEPERADPPPAVPSTASGPQLQVGNRTLSALHLTYQLLGRRYVDCLCTGFGLWASSLRQPGGQASVTTVFPALPAGTTRVDVLLPTATTVWRLPVSPAFDGAARLGPPRRAAVDTWTYLEDQPPAGWTTAQWPTPVPDRTQLADYESFVERLLPSS